MTSSFPTADICGMALDAALAESRRFLKSTLDALSAHIAILDEHGIIIEVNAAWIRFARENGFPGGRHGLGDNYLKACETAAGDDSEQALKMAQGIRAVMAGKTNEFCLEYPCHTSQQQRWFIGRATRFAGEGPVRVVMAHENITQRKQAESQLRKLSHAVEQSPVSIIITNLQGVIEYVNPKFCALTGYSFEEVRGKNPRILKAGEMRSEDCRQMRARINAGHDWSGEFHNRKKNGAPYWESVSISPIRNDTGKVAHFVAVTEDITGRKQAEAVLREQFALREKLAKIAAKVPGVIYSFRLRPDGSACIPYASPTIEDFCGARAEDLVNNAWPLFNLIPADDRARVQESIAKSVHAMSPWRAEFRVQHPKKGLFWAEGQATPEREADGCILWHGFMSDITERRRAQAEKKSSEQMVAEHKMREESARLALEHQQKLSQIQSRFVSMVSHEFRTPLSIINLAAELLDGYLDHMTQAERSEQVKEIQGAVARMTQMMTDFLVHENCTSGKVECQTARADVTALCQRIIAEVPGQGGPPRTIECHIDPAVGCAWLDETILRHILGNLLSNAVKYSLEGQTVKLEVRRVAGSDQPNAGTGPSAETYLEFKVSDSGIGIPAADLAKVDQAFHRAANVGNRPGAGMGLAIVKQFVDLLRGHIRIESQEGKGTAIWVELPIVSPAAREES